MPWSDFILAGFALFILVCVYDLVRLCVGLVNRWVLRPRADAEASFRSFQAWQEEQLRDTPYVVAPRDATRPDDDEGLSPLVEIWRRGG